MSAREQCNAILDTFDDAFCMKMYEDYISDPEHGDFVSFEDALKECGVSLDEL